MADDSPAVSAAAAAPVAASEDDGACDSVVLAADVSLVLASVAAVFFVVFRVSSCYDAISSFLSAWYLTSLLRMLELDWQTVGVLSYICTLNCQSIRA